MKKMSKLSLFFMLFLICPMVIIAQPGKGKGKGKGKASKVAAKLAVEISGTITEWTHNDDFRYDGFYLQSERGSYFVKIPTHMARAVYDCGNIVTVEGTLRQSPAGVREIRMFSVRGNGLVVNNVPASRPRTAPLAEIVSGTGTATKLQLNKKGDVSGYFLNDGIILRVPPHIARQLTQLVQSNTVLEYTGIVKTLKDGEMSKDNYTIIRCQTIAVNGARYLIN